ncbi:anti-sigma factor RsbA family regulatory protein [Actinoplanes auranticolor]|uniref:Anti-sigma regulatory factor n=1 Tax=Actinoplanes auranticolor TaxID=47988 RepID=A0A919VNF2_9ACTN|nr:anti-sigma factor RsbA family regulatory protein [Actinoplanes auranticolor]GIM72699.1 anti-sigma regulatory factor [Actinoplanes auranticolor]
MQGSGVAADARPAFTHSAFFYDSDTAYGSTLAAFIRDGLAHDEAVAVAANAHCTGLLRDALAADAAEVRFLPAEEWYVRPVRTIAGWSQLLRAAASSGRSSMRLIGHTTPAHGARGWVRFESALNSSLAGLRGHLLCPYDRSNLPAATVRTAELTHPRLYDDGWLESAGYEPPERLLTELPEPPYPVTGEPVIAVPVHDSVAGLRAQVRARAAAEGWLPADRVENLLLALSEVATNGIRHGGEHRELRVWLTDDAVVCEVTDDGRVPPGPLAGYLPPRPGRIGGMGLWLVQQLCDAMAIRSVDGLTRARFALRRSPA